MGKSPGSVGYKASPAWPPMALVSSSLALTVTLGAVISAGGGSASRQVPWPRAALLAHTLLLFCPHFWAS